MSQHQAVLVVDAALRGIRLTEFLERHVPGIHRTALRQCVGRGGVRVNGEAVRAERRLKSGDIVEVLELTERAAPQAAAPARPEVLFESDTALVVAKPPGLPTVPDRSGREPGVHGLLGELRPAADLRIVHRLDRDTSGCLLLAKGLPAARHFDAELRAARLQKHYRALVHGVVRREAFTIDAWLGPDRRRPGKVVAATDPRKGFRRAETGVELRRAFAGYSLLDLHPRTGRGHQLRVHLASVGHPIVGDRDYGGRLLLLSDFKRGYKPRLGFEERPLVGRQFLHALGLRFTDLDGGEIAVQAPMPDDLSAAVAKLERFADRPR